MSRISKSVVTLVSLVAAATGTSALLRRRRRPRVFILEYHDVSDSSAERGGVISDARFRRHLRYLKRHYSFESLRGAAARLRDTRALAQDLVVVTFDDGYAGNYESAWPVLEEERVPAAIFLTSGFLDGSELWFDFARRSLEAAHRAGRALPPALVQSLHAVFGRWPPAGGTEAAMKRLKHLVPEARDRLLAELRSAPLRLSPAAEPLRWEEVRRLLAAGIEIGCHTVSHPVLPTLSRPLQEEEIRKSRHRIAEETGILPATFAYPNGDFNRDTLDILREEGFTAACTTLKGSNRPGCELLELRRIGVGSDPCFVLAARLAGLFDEEVRRRFARRSG